MRAPSDLAEVEPAQGIEPAYDWSGWERWLRGHLDIERQLLIEGVGEALGLSRKGVRAELEPHLKKISALEIKVAELSGAVDVLRGKQPPPPAKFPMVRAWQEDVVYHEGDVVVFAGGCYQAAKDTARAPGTQDWICLATRGNGLAVRGTYNDDVEYCYLDIVIINGSSFVALKDKPGPCPGPEWQLLASRGSRGDRGLKGEHGLTGPRGGHGQAAAGIQSWQIDRAHYAATPMMSDGSAGPTLELRGLFEQFVSERGA
jgi:hypothetical protein